MYFFRQHLLFILFLISCDPIYVKQLSFFEKLYFETQTGEKINTKLGLDKVEYLLDSICIVHGLKNDSTKFYGSEYVSWQSTKNKHFGVGIFKKNGFYIIKITSLLAPSDSLTNQIMGDLLNTVKLH
jgi:hypothetical protein